VAQSQINLNAPGDYLVFMYKGNPVGGLALRVTANDKPQLVVAGRDGKAAATIGGDREPYDVQFTPEPMDHPRVSFQSGYIPSGAGQGGAGDFWTRGAIAVGDPDCWKNDKGELDCPTDPAGALAIARCRLEDSSYIRMFRRDIKKNVLEELARIGITDDGYVYFSDGHDTPRISFRFDRDNTKIRLLTDRKDKYGELSFDDAGALNFSDGQNDTPRLSFLFDRDNAKIRVLRRSDSKYGELSFDNSGALKYQGPNGTLTTLAQP
jgi:hypothetical protein